jgi:hypothetical protein
MTEHCCSSSPLQTDWLGTCPSDNTKGQPIQLITLKSLLVPEALTRLEPSSTYRFCPSLNCPIVYFSQQGKTFTTNDLKVAVFQKETDNSVPVCYCFGWSRQRIHEESKRLGNNFVMNEITTHVKAKRCGCEVNNPQGSCCLANVRHVIEQVI